MGRLPHRETSATRAGRPTPNPSLPGRGEEDVPPFSVTRSSQPAPPASSTSARPSAPSASCSPAPSAAAR
ncbi:MAG: hypothetical protein DI640_05580 [Sphingomonas taxi]|uniref:Uncharacterized protein n=1 Tax=Sphingomonas taxi TaxID=1549858 RepID=A0A2W4Z4R3_9SPHN|nr:MAG: hypothetical protein DI640_05580 [Sphingomonas taxi]